MMEHSAYVLRNDTQVIPYIKQTYTLNFYHTFISWFSFISASIR